MTILPRNSIKETGWGNTKEPRTAPREVFLDTINMHRCILLLQLNTKRLNPSHESLFDILPSDILANIDIWLSGLENCNKFKHFISRFKFMCNPILFEITYNIWTLYHNLCAFCWYNKVKYDWSNRRIMARDHRYWTYYEYYTKQS